MEPLNLLIPENSALQPVDPALADAYQLAALIQEHKAV